MAGNDPTVLTEAAFRELRREYWRQRRQLNNFEKRLATFGVRRHQTRQIPPPRVRFKNSSGETAPAHAVMRIIDAEWNYVEISKPNTSFNGLYLVNGHREVPSGRMGWGHFLTSESFMWKRQYALYNNAALPAPGQSWGVVSGSWALHQHGPGFFILGARVDDEAKSRVAAIQYTPPFILGKLASASTKGGAAVTVNVWGGPAGSEAASGLTIPNCYNRVATITSTSVFVIVRFINGQAYVEPYEQTSQEVMLDMRIKSGDTHVEAHTITVWGNYIGSPAWEDKIELDDCP